MNLNMPVCMANVDLGKPTARGNKFYSIVYSLIFVFINRDIRIDPFALKHRTMMDWQDFRAACFRYSTNC